MGKINLGPSNTIPQRTIKNESSDSVVSTVENIVEVVKEVEKIVEVIKEVNTAPTEIIKEVIVEKPVEVVKEIIKERLIEVPVEVVKYVDKPVEIIKIVDRPIKVIEFVDRPIEIRPKYLNFLIAGCIVEAIAIIMLIIK